MAARVPRRTFASPFVVTFAAACSTSAPPPATAPPAEPEPVASGSSAGPSAGPTNPEPVQPKPPETTEPPVVVTTNPPPPPPPPPPADASWTVFKNGAKCQAMAKIECPKGPPGGPMPTCNPPPAIDYACPENASFPITIVTRGAACVIDQKMPPCPPKMHCNPPPQRQVPCPK